MSKLVPLAALAALAAAACATAPAGPTRRICHDQAVAVRFADAGVPAGERPLDIALTPTHLWVLFSPHRLLRVDRAAGKVSVQGWVGDEGEEWTALAADPGDGSAWIAADHYRLVHVRPEGRLERFASARVSGDGSLTHLMVGPEQIVGVPELATERVWRFDRRGELVGTDFPISEAALLEAQEGGTPATPRLERDRDGALLLWDPLERRAWRLDAAGGWSPADGALFAGLPEPGPTLGVVDVGGAATRWFFPSPRGSLFFWKGREAFLGERAVGDAGERDTVLMLPAPGGYRPVIEDCYGAELLALRTDARGYAALTERLVVHGVFDAATPALE